MNINNNGFINFILGYLNFDFSFVIWFKILFILFFIVLNIILFLGLDSYKIDNNIEYLESGLNDRIIKNAFNKFIIGATFYGTYLSHKSDVFNRLEKKALIEARNKEAKELHEEIIKLKTEATTLSIQNIQTKEFLEGQYKKLDNMDKLVDKTNMLLNSKEKTTDLNEKNNIEMELKTTNSRLLDLLNNTKRDFTKFSENNPDILSKETVQDINKAVEDLNKTVDGDIEENKINNDIIDPNKSSIFNGFIEKFENLDTVGKLAFALLFSKSVIISCFISLSFIYYGDYLITKFNLENKFPKLAYIIKLRRQFTKYYLISNCLTIAFAILIEIVFSIAILL